MTPQDAREANRLSVATYRDRKRIARLAQLDAESEWRPLDWAPSYEVSADGRVRRGSVLLRGTVDQKGYRTVHLLGRDGRPYRVHTLVAHVFLGPRPSGLEIRHLNDKKLDNRLTNLAYGTHTENLLDRARNGIDPHANAPACRNGHPFTPDNTHQVKRGDRVGRRCATCARTASRRYKEARR